MATIIQNPPPANTSLEPEDNSHAGKQMSFLEHLEELRQRLLRSVFSICIAFGICFYFAHQIYAFLARPITKTLQDLHMDTELAYTSPTDPFNISIKLALVAAIFLASPYVLLQVWLFISPGLYRHEKRYVWPFVMLTTGLFLAGGFFAYAMAFPAALKFLLEYGSHFHMKMLVTINEYMSLAATIMLGVGLVFELPVIVLLLSIFGIVTPRFLIRNIRYAILITAILAAALAPTPDWTTLFMFWIPMVGLYILSFGLSWLVYLRKKWAQQKSTI